MTSKFLAAIKRMKPTTKDAVKATLANGRAHAGGVLAFEEDVVRTQKKAPASRSKAVKTSVK